MKISVIIPTFNSQNTIKKCIKSVLDQTYRNFEIICVDDGSIDSTIKIIKSFRDKRIKVIRLRHTGIPSRNMNIAAKQSKGKYLAVLDSDDFWHKNKLNQQVCNFKNEFYEAYCSNGFSLSKIKKTKIINKSFKKLSLFDFLFDNYVIFQSLIITKKLFFILSGFSENKSIKTFYDLDFCIKYCILGKKILFINHNLVYYSDNPKVSNRKNSPSNIRKFLYLSKSLLFWSLDQKVFIRTIFFIKFFFIIRSFKQFKKFFRFF